MGSPGQADHLNKPGSLTGEAPGNQTAHFFAPQRNAGHFSRFLAFCLRKRRAVLLGIFAFMVAAEVLEQVLAIRFGPGLHIYFDVFLFLGILPAGAWLLLRLMKEVDFERKQAQARSDLYTEFSQKLGEARTWDELVLQIVAFPHRIVPQARITLFTVNSVDQSLQPEVACERDGQVTLKPEVKFNPGSLPQLLIQPDSAIPPAQAALIEAFHLRQETSVPASPAPHRYDLPIPLNGQQIAVIKLEFEPGMAPSADQIRALKAAAPVMALALEGALLQQMAVEQAAASQTQRQEIAQTLHDTLAQNVGYLRLKLDQLTGENAIREIGEVLQELSRMRSTADEAYQQVRNTLDELNPSQAGNLVSTLFKQGRVISQRAGFNLHTSQVGTAYNLPAPTRQQILYIVREALYNVEKHARADQVHLQFLWLDSELIIKVTDDGVGFNPRNVSTEGHYGLWIMQQRAQEINGTLKIGPAADGSGDAPGTEVTLWVPCPSPKMPAKEPAYMPMEPAFLRNEPAYMPAESFSVDPLAQPDLINQAVTEPERIIH